MLVFVSLFFCAPGVVGVNLAQIRQQLRQQILMQRRWLAFQPRVMTALARDFAKVLNRCGDKYLAGSVSSIGGIAIGGMGMGMFWYWY